MLNKAKILNGLQTALPNSRLMWEAEGHSQATIIIGLTDMEHFIGISLVEPDLTEEQLVANILKVITS